MPAPMVMTTNPGMPRPSPNQRSASASATRSFSSDDGDAQLGLDEPARRARPSSRGTGRTPRGRLGRHRRATRRRPRGGRRSSPRPRSAISAATPVAGRGAASGCSAYAQRAPARTSVATTWRASPVILTPAKRARPGRDVERPDRPTDRPVGPVVELDQEPAVEERLRQAGQARRRQPEPARQLAARDRAVDQHRARERSLAVAQHALDRPLVPSWHEQALETRAFRFEVASCATLLLPC